MKKGNIFLKMLGNQKLLALIGLVILGIMAHPLYVNFKKRYEIRTEVKNLEKEISTLESKNNKLDELIKYLESDQFAEEQARLKLNYRKEGEEVMVIDRPGNNQAEDIAPGQTKPSENVFNIKGLENVKPIQPASNPRKWIEFFLG